MNTGRIISRRRKRCCPGDKYTDRSALDYFLRGKSRRVIHPETSELLEKLLTMLAEQGEDAVFAYIRGLVRAGKEY